MAKKKNLNSPLIPSDNKLTIMEILSIGPMSVQKILDVLNNTLIPNKWNPSQYSSMRLDGIISRASEMKRRHDLENSRLRAIQGHREAEEAREMQIRYYDNIREKIEKNEKNLLHARSNLEVDRCRRQFAELRPEYKRAEEELRRLTASVEMALQTIKNIEAQLYRVTKSENNASGNNEKGDAAHESGKIGASGSKTINSFEIDSCASYFWIKEGGEVTKNAIECLLKRMRRDEFVVSRKFINKSFKGSEALYALTELGVQVLVDRKGYSAQTVRNTFPSKLTLSHEAQVTDCLWAIKREGSLLGYSSFIVDEVALKQDHPRQKQYPDLLVKLTRGQKSWSYNIEVDNNTEHPRRLFKKVSGHKGPTVILCNNDGRLQQLRKSFEKLLPELESDDERHQFLNNVVFKFHDDFCRNGFFGSRRGTVNGPMSQYHEDLGARNFLSLAADNDSEEH